MGHNEPFWRTNTSFSPPLSRRWDQRFQFEGPSFGSYGDGGIALSSLSSNSKESRSWMRGEQFPNHNYSASDGAVSYVSSPSYNFQMQQLMPPPVQGVNINDFVSSTTKEPSSGHLSSSRFVEGTPGIPHSVGSTSSRSDGSEYEPMSKIHGYSHRNFSSRCSFMSKPVHPLSFPDQNLEVEEGPGSVATTNSNRSDLKSIRALTELQYLSGFLDSGIPQREAFRWSSASSIDFTDVSEQIEPESSGFSLNNLYDCGRCGLCERLLSQRSPWSSRRIVRSGDMPVAGVLSCWHVYHAECLERTTPRTRKHDPPCPLCEKTEENITEQWAISRLKNGFPRLRSLGEEGPLRSWSCGQVGDCVEGALHSSPRNSMVSLNRSRLRRHMSLKGSSSKERSEKSRKNGMHSSIGCNGQKLVDQGAVGCSRTTPGSSLKRW